MTYLVPIFFCYLWERLRELEGLLFLSKSLCCELKPFCPEKKLNSDSLFQTLLGWDQEPIKVHILVGSHVEENEAPVFTEELSFFIFFFSLFLGEK